MQEVCFLCNVLHRLSNHLNWTWIFHLNLSEAYLISAGFEIQAYYVHNLIHFAFSHPY